MVRGQQYCPASIQISYHSGPVYSFHSSNTSALFGNRQPPIHRRGGVIERLSLNCQASPYENSFSVWNKARSHQDGAGRARVISRSKRGVIGLRDSPTPRHAGSGT